jgi:hypothetical protein
MTTRVRFGPYRLSRRTLVVLAVAEVGPASGVVATFAGWDGHVAIKVGVALVLIALAALVGWAMLSRTVTNEDHVEARMLWRIRRIPWSQIQDIRVESDPAAAAFDRPTETVVIYDQLGRRITLPCFDNLNLERRGLHLTYGWPVASEAARIHRYGC